MFAFLLVASPAFAMGELTICPKSTQDLNFNILCNLSPANALPALLSFILIAAIIISLIYLIWGGIKWITSGGDKGNVETARGHIIAAIIGLVLVFSAWFIMNFILQTFFGGNLQGGISLPTVFFQQTPTPTPVPEETLSPTPLPDGTEPTSSLPPCPTAFPPNYECQLIDPAE